MTTIDRVATERSSPAVRLALPVFAVTLSLSAFLLFSVQPFFAKMVLPRLGGSPGVWSVAMVFFQGVLLLGYGYAHLLTSRLGLRAAALVHASVLAAAFLFLPIAIPAGWETPPETGQSLWLLGLFGVSVGMPFFAVSANAPLLQAWFARTGHPHAADPYFLYGASNLGSFASLILFIVFFEPLFTLSQQSAMWAAGFAVLAAMIVGAAMLVISVEAPVEKGPENQARGEVNGSIGERARWILFAFIPSGLLVAVTAHISVDVAAAPFLWVAPLALFLLTFVLAFARRPIFTIGQLGAVLPFAATAALIAIYAHSMIPIWIALCIHLAFFFIAALFCHSLLVARRPPAARLTAFYLWMSFGGVLGGIFASLIAPITFEWVAEYVLLIVLVMVIGPRIAARPAGEIATFVATGAVLGAMVLTGAQFEALERFFSGGALAVVLIGFAFAALVIGIFQPAARLIMLIPVIPLAFLQSHASGELFQERSFFGVVRVSDTADGRFRLMRHGTTIHGAMALSNSGDRPEPLTYYHSSGGIAAAIHAMQERRGGAMDQVGAIGLGTGSAFCHRAPGETWTGFEIDRSVVDAAVDKGLFSFMPSCAPDAPMIVGDARITLAGEPDHRYDLLLVDAFSSDSIPVHLMTREAIALYLSKVVADGVVVMHISNRHLELGSVLAAIARDEGLAIRTGHFTPDEDDAERHVAKSRVAVIAREAAHFGPMLDDPRWTVPEAGTTRAWTDDYSNIISAMMRKK